MPTVAFRLVPTAIAGLAGAGVYGMLRELGILVGDDGLLSGRGLLISGGLGLLLLLLMARR